MSGNNQVRLLISLAAVCMLTVLNGCRGEQPPKCYPVRGQVKFNNQPAAEAQVVFHPVSTGVDMPRPIAVCDSEGKFELNTFGGKDGAVPGEYRITVELRAPQDVGGELVRQGPNLMPPRYADPQSSGLTFTVQPAPNEVPSIEIPNR